MSVSHAGAMVGTARVRAAVTAPFALLALGATAASVGVILIESGGVLVNPDGYAALVVFGTVTFIAAGLYWQVWQPASRFGRLLIALGFLLALGSLQGAANPALFGVGLLVDIPTALLAWYVLLAYPSNALDRLGRLSLTTAAVYFACVYLPWLLVTPVASGMSPLARCTPDCPANPLQVVDRPGLTAALHDLMPAARVMATALICVALAARLVSASTAQQRKLVLVVGLGLLWVFLLMVFKLAEAATGIDSQLTSNLAFGVVTARAMIPAAFLLAPLQARAFAGVALQRMLRRFETAPTLRERETVMADVLEDPRLRLAFWLPRSRQYVDVEGRVAELPTPESGLAWFPVERGGEPAAALIHHARLTDDHELLDAAGHALLLAIDNRRAADELELSVAELRRSRRRLVAADAAERRRLERELHGTAQQHLVAVRVSLELARERAEVNSALADRLATLGRELDQTVDDLRRIASGIYPTLLEQAGLNASLLDAARRFERPLELDLHDVGRVAPEVEHCIYFCVVEALANSLAHSGRQASTRVRLTRDGRAVHFSVSDDGRGFDVARTRHGTGLQGITERVAAVDGTVSIVSVPGRGTVVSGMVPAGVPDRELVP